MSISDKLDLVAGYLEEPISDLREGLTTVADYFESIIKERNSLKARVLELEEQIRSLMPFLEEVKGYIEDSEISLDSEYGTGHSTTIEQVYPDPTTYPPLYIEVLKRLSSSPAKE